MWVVMIRRQWYTQTGYLGGTENMWEPFKEKEDSIFPKYFKTKEEVETIKKQLKFNGFKEEDIKIEET